ncbi:hypothetical protein [Terriglobus albidus]|uniref:hypothetical protein n=1 Tax=Terriglobus albidus TaxID=1592106 RepID=UPI0021E0FCAA|nr:hypothetical protein [Terriglobus albidus]
MTVSNSDRLAIRWTIGNVHARGFEMLRLSVACAARLFGPGARYVVCVNSVPLPEAQQRTAGLPADVEWRETTLLDAPKVLLQHTKESLMEGMGWKLVPLRTHPERYELALDNDCILWTMTRGIQAWLDTVDGYLFAEDVDRCLGSFDALCPPGSFNAGIRGLPPYHDLQSSLAAVLEEVEHRSGSRADLTSEIEEQGLQAAAMLRNSPLYLVKTSEVSICSPFWPRSPELGRCGAHFVGMNAKHLPWSYYDRPADEWLAEHWERCRPALYQKAGLPLP